MNESGIEIKIVEKWPQNEIVELYKAGGWWKDEYNASSLKDLIKGSFAFAVAIDSNSKKAIGMGRLISDGISDAYLQDLIVIPTFRKKGIGKQIAQTLIDYCKKRKITWLGLISEPDQDGFYKKLGFKIMEKHRPMLYYGEK
jgi:ribosomal protein S18 acetylase RimI-like enzyme